MTTMTEKDLDIAIEKCERIMEFDTWTLKNPESENGWIFDKVYDLLRFLRQFQFATDTNVGGNLIDRQAALDAIKKLEKPAPTAQHLSAIFDCEDTIKALPSAHPSVSKTEIVGDVISRAAALTALERDEEYDKDIPNRADGVRDAIITISALPSAQLAQDLPNGCTDTISRQAVLNLIEQSCCDLEYACDNVALRKEVEALPSAQPGWIPCSETPKEDGRYLVSVRILHEYNKVMVSRFDNGEFWDSDVVAWMPLPKPWEGGQDNGTD